MKRKITSIINHIYFVVDGSTSMCHLQKDVVKVFDSQVEYLQRRSKELEQETRISLYVFGSKVENVVFDMDCLRMPSLEGYYEVNGMTALIDGTLKSIEDGKKIPELYGDTSHLVYVLTDGCNNISNHKAPLLAETIRKLPDNWTVAVFVPDATGIHECKRLGFPASNIAVWDATSGKGTAEMGETVRKTTEVFMTNRAAGVRGTKDLFKLETSKVTSDKVRSKLKALGAEEYLLLSVHQDSVIKGFVESWTQAPYVAGSAYYQLTKSEKVQSYKQVALRNKISGKVYAGTEARKMLGLPDYEVKVEVAHLNGYDIFIQSSSQNRKLLAGSQCLVLV